MLEGGLAPRVLVKSFKNRTSAAMHWESLGGCTCEYPEDYYHENDDSENNREHQLHPLSGGFFLIQTAYCRKASSEHIIKYLPLLFK